MNEDENGVTPPEVTAMTLEPWYMGGWLVTIEQGNGTVIKMIELTEMERMQLITLLGCVNSGMPLAGSAHVSFTDSDRSRTEPYPVGRSS
jgi:hypothetical protein